jgi:DNA-binding CsgD family transcriptional regulator
MHKDLRRDRLAKNGSNDASLRVSHNFSDVGFLLLDGYKRLIFANDEVVQILTYPSAMPARNSHGIVNKLVREKLYPMLHGEITRRQIQTVCEYQSGRRHYVCRVFGVTSRPGYRDQDQDIAVLLERISRPALDIDKIQRRFGLSKREQEALGHLAKGLTTKEIALRMEISPNTAKVFLRMVMIKMGAQNRTSVMSKIIEFCS